LTIDVTDTATTRVCTLTGLRLVRPAQTPLHRVAKHQYGPLNPQLRGSGSNRHSWGRWDSAGGRTIYAGQTGLAAFAELLPYIQENLPGSDITDFFDDADDLAGRSLASVVLSEMPSQGLHHAVTAGWRDKRTHYQLAVSADQSWFVDIAAKESLSALNAAIRPGNRELPPVTLSTLTGEQRDITTAIATRVRAQDLDDGTRALGITYRSKHGIDLPAYALWLRSTDDGNPEAEPIEIVDSSSIPRDHPDLVQAAKLHHMKVIW